MPKTKRSWKTWIRDLRIRIFNEEISVGYRSVEHLRTRGVEEFQKPVEYFRFYCKKHKCIHETYKILGRYATEVSAIQIGNHMEIESK